MSEEPTKADTWGSFLTDEGLDAVGCSPHAPLVEELEPEMVTSPEPTTTAESQHHPQAHGRNDPLVPVQATGTTVANPMMANTPAGPFYGSAGPSTVRVAAQAAPDNSKSNPTDTEIRI